MNAMTPGAFLITLCLALPAAAHIGPADVVQPNEDFQVAQAKADSSDGDRSWRKKRRKKREHKVRRKMQTFITLELSAALDLDEKKTLKLSAAIKKVQEQREGKHRAVRQAMRGLKEMVESNASDGKLKSQMKKLSQARQEAQGMEDALLENTRSFLTTKEQAKLTLVLPEVMREMRRMAGKAMKQNKRERKMRKGEGPGRD